MGQAGALGHLNSGEATTILASCGSRGYSAMMLPTCRRGAAAREAIQSDHGMGLSWPHVMRLGDWTCQGF